MKTIANIAKALAVAAAAVGSVACVIDTSEPSREICFRSVTHKPALTRTILDTSLFPTDEEFKVYGYFSPDAVTTATYIDAENVGYDADNVWRCQSATTYYWPLSGQMKFYAYYPTNIAATVSSSAGVRIDNYHITAANLQDDVLYATTTVTCPPATPTAPLAFSHALTQVCFTAQLAEDFRNGTEPVGVVINSITLNNINSAGNFQQNPLGWRDQKTLQSYTVLSGGTDPVTYVGAMGTPAEVGTPVLMIPQSMPAGASLTVVYTVTQTTSSGTTYSDPVTKTVPITFQWAVNRKVAYNLSISLNSIQFDVTDCQWAESSGGEIFI